MKLIAGLGNPDKKYPGTRHNVGFMAVEYLAGEKAVDFSRHKKSKSMAARLEQAGEAVILLKPQTYMNRSGEVVAAAQRFFDIPPGDTLIVYDDAALGFGTIRARQGGESAGHNGIKSVIAHCGDEFSRLRLGIANEHSEKQPAETFVLSRFAEEEKDKLPEILEMSSRFMETFIEADFPADTYHVE